MFPHYEMVVNEKRGNEVEGVGGGGCSWDAITLKLAAEKEWLTLCAEESRIDRSGAPSTGTNAD